MSWKLFGQIVLLIIIAAIVMSVTKCVKRSLHHGMAGKMSCTECIKK